MPSAGNAFKSMRLSTFAVNQVQYVAYIFIVFMKMNALISNCNV